jgi:hypothetical protein
MGGVDKHDKLRSTFSFGKRHKLKKYYVKLLLFLVDISLTNSWLYYKLVNEEKLKKNGESRADFFLCVAQAIDVQLQIGQLNTSFIAVDRRTSDKGAHETEPLKITYQ